VAKLRRKQEGATVAGNSCRFIAHSRTTSPALACALRHDQQFVIDAGATLHRAAATGPAPRTASGVCAGNLSLRLVERQSASWDELRGIASAVSIDEASGHRADGHVALVAGHDGFESSHDMLEERDRGKNESAPIAMTILVGGERGKASLAWPRGAGPKFLPLARACAAQSFSRRRTQGNAASIVNRYMLQHWPSRALLIILPATVMHPGDGGG
jgi:hypothetical protein